MPGAARRDAIHFSEQLDHTTLLKGGTPLRHDKSAAGAIMRDILTCCVAGVVLVCLCPVSYAQRPEATPKEPPSVAWGDYRVEVNEQGNLGRIYLQRGYGEFDAMLRRAEASGVQPNVWKVALLLVPTFDVTWKDHRGEEHRTVATLTPEQMEHARECFRTLSQYATAYTGGHLKFATTEFVFPEPVVLVTGPNQKGFFFPPPLKEQMIESFPDWRPEEFDSVVCIFPPGDMPTDAFGRSWGQLHGPLKAGNANIAYVAERIAAGGHFSIVMQHEWLHQAESVMTQNLGYLGLPNLHDAGLCGYRPGQLDQPQWLAWNRDFMFRLYRPAMWHKADMNSRSWSRPAPKFDGGFLRRWLVRGPFPNEEKAGLDVDFLDGEADVIPKPAGETAFPIEDNTAWHAVDAPALFAPLAENATEEQREQRAEQEDIVNFARAFKPNANSVAYAHVYVQAERTEEALLWLGSDDGVKVFFNGLVVHRHRVDRGVAKDLDRVPVMMKKGWNRLLVKVDQGGGGWGFCARLSAPDGRPIEGLTTALELPEGARVEAGTLVPVEWDGKLYAWDDVKDDAWGRLPQLDQQMLRAMTGLDELAIETAPGVLCVDPGTTSSVRSPVLGELDAGDGRRDAGEARLNNQLTYANESLAWIRYRARTNDERFTSSRRDVLLVRWDVIDPWMSWLRSRSSVAAGRSLAGYVAVNKQVAYVVYTDLGERAPGRELDLVSPEAGGIAASVSLERAESLTAKEVGAHLDIENTTAERVKFDWLTVECEADDVETVGWSAKVALDRGGRLTKDVPLLRVARDAAPGLKPVRVRLHFSTAEGRVVLEKWLAVRVVQPVGVALVVDGPSIVRSGRTRKATLALTNNAAHLGTVAWRVSGGGIKARPSSGRFIIKPVPDVSITDLALSFSRRRRSGYTELSTKLDVAERTVPDSRGSQRVYVGGKDGLLRHDFRRDLHGWHRRTGTWSVERGTEGGRRRRGHALIKDGGGAKFGAVVIFGPAEGEERDWDLAYSSDEYPMLEFRIAAKDTGNTALIVLADGAWYALVLTGEFIEQWGTRKELGNLGLEPDGEAHEIAFNLDEALDRVAGEGDHAVEQIWIGDTRTHSSNQWRGPDVGTITIDGFTIR